MELLSGFFRSGFHRFHRVARRTISGAVAICLLLLVLSSRGDLLALIVIDVATDFEVKVSL